MATITTTDQSLLRLMQLSSANLPVGGYAFSQGLEYAVESGWISDEQGADHWIRLLMRQSMARVDLPILWRLEQALQQKRVPDFWLWNATLLACRETKELLLNETAMGTALVRLLKQFAIELPDHNSQKNRQKIAFLSAFVCAGQHWQIAPKAMAIGYLWSWLENQIAAAIKLVPLGQSAAQKLLVSLSEDAAEIIEQSWQIDDTEIGSSLPGVAMASSWHETQYSRLFRS